MFMEHVLFSSGPIGHVWAQVLIGDTWVVADPVSLETH